MTTLCIDELNRALKQRWGWPGGADHVPPARLQLQPGDTVIGQPAMAAPSIRLREIIGNPPLCPAWPVCTSWQGRPINGIMANQTE